MAILNNSNAISSGGYDINNSLRFRSSASAYLNRTLSTPTNNKKWTFSVWLKRGKVDSYNGIFSSAVAGTGYSTIRIDSSGYLDFVQFNGTSNLVSLTSNRLLRDPAAWYHIFVSVDTTQATSSDRVSMYVNNEKITSFINSTYPSQNLDTYFNSATSHNVGRNVYSGSTDQPFDGYLTDVNFIDGQALTPSSFGSTNSLTGVWQPAKYTGTYGTNGFYLPFTDNSGATATTIGKDFSGNSNNWTPNNISVTAGTTYDSMTDVPTLTSATAANYAVMTPAYLPRGSYTLSEANLKCSGAYASSNYPRIMSSMGMTSGKYYWEYVGVTFPATESCSIGIKEVSSAYPSATGGLGAVSGEIGLFNTGRLDNNGSTTTSFSTTFTTSDVIGIAFDATNGTLNYYKNGSAIGSQITGIAAGTYAPAFDCLSTSQTVWCVNYGQRPFSYTPPTGFVRLNTYNLPDSTIKKGNTVMDATLYTGNLTGQSITNAAAFKPDLVWIKSRSAATDNKLTDSVRGATKALVSNSSAAETTDVTGMTAFNTNGFTVGASTTYNNTGATYVGWQWQAGQSSGSSNTSGTITSTVSVSTTAGFSIVTYTGTGSAATIGHGLGVAPRMIITKGRNATIEWLVYHASLGATQYITLNTTGAAASAASAWNNTAPTSSVFSVLSAGSTNFSGTNYVAYCWAEIAGFSKFTSYVGNGNADGPFVYCGFRPKYVMYKDTANGSTNWEVVDSARNTTNPEFTRLFPNQSNADDNGVNPVMDFTANGFKIRTSAFGANNNGNTHIVMAFAENPFKNSLAR